MLIGKDRRMKREGWVTFGRDEGEVKNALILLRSLRHQFTNKQVILILSRNVPEDLWKPLENSFNAVYFFPSHSTSSSEDFQEAALVHAFSLVAYEKIVFLNPSSLVLENCDEIFEENNLQFGTGSVVILKPDIFMHSKGIKALHDGREGLKKFETQMKKTKEGTITSLERKYDFSITEAQSVQLSQEELLLISPKIIHFQKDRKEILANGKILKMPQFFESVWNLRSELEKEVKDFLKTGAQIEKGIQWNGYGNEPIAIVGMSCKMPGANNLNEYWKIFIEGKCSVKEIPEDRWTLEQGYHLSEDEKNTQGGFLPGRIDLFDNQFFGMSPTECEYVDPQQRLLLESVWEALEDGGINPQTLVGTLTGVYTGAWNLDYKDLLQNAEENNNINFRLYMGNSFGTLASRVAHFFKLTGTNVGSESGCSSSSVAIGMGVKSLRMGEVDMAFACGVNLLVKPYTSSAFGGLLSKDQRCFSFDNTANGFVRAEGCGVLILKRLSDAIKEGDRIHCLIRGYGASQEGQSNSMGTPTINGERMAMEMALNDAQIKAQDVQLIEAHGTGTVVGDAVEIKSIASVYSNSVPGRKSPLWITAGKANTGHTEASSGVAGVIKTVLEMKNAIIPSQIYLNNINKKIIKELVSIPAKIISDGEPKPWSSDNGPRIAGVNSFGITGTDTHILLQEMPNKTLSIYKEKYFSLLKEPPANLLTLSSKTSEGLDALLKEYKNFLIKAEKSELSLSSIAFTANTGRALFNHRICVVGGNCGEISDKLESGVFERSIVKDVDFHDSDNKNKTNICFLFPGQGTQWHGMGKQFYEHFPVFKVNFDHCEKILKSNYGFQLKQALWGEDETLLVDSLYSQSAIFVMEYCLVKLLESWGIVPSSVLGHSLGEFCAATTAGFLSLNDALILLGARSKLISALKRGKMAAVKANQSKVQELMSSFLWQRDHRVRSNNWIDIAAINSNEQTTVAGPPETIEDFAKFCKSSNIKCVILESTHAFHSRDMDPMLHEYEGIASSIKYQRNDQINFISGLEGKVLKSVDASYWIKHTRQGVQFSQAVGSFFSNNDNLNTLFIEVGPHPVLSALIHANIPSNLSLKFPPKCFPTMRKPPANGGKGESGKGISLILETMAKIHVLDIAPINFNEFHRFQPKEKVDVPFYQFQRKKFWMPLPLNLKLKGSFKGNGNEMRNVPLLGKQFDFPIVPLSSKVGQREKRFQNFINLQTHSYIAHHKIGKFAFLPAAGFVEMSIAAYSTTLQNKGENYNLTVENIFVKSPIVLDDNKYAEVQTVLLTRNEAPNTTTINIFRKNETKSNALWTNNFEATINLSSQEENSLSENESLDQIKTRLEIQPNYSPYMYEELFKLGYNFGPLFQSLNNIWKGSEGENVELLAEIKIPLDLLNTFNESYNHEEGDFNGAHCHPVVIDAMIQSVLFSNPDKPDGLYLPVMIKKIVLLKNIEIENFQNSETDTDATFYVYVENSPQKIATLYSHRGSILARMSGVEFLKTSLNMLEKKIIRETGTIDNLEMPPIYKEEWIPAVKDFSIEKFQNYLLPNMKNELGFNNFGDQADNLKYEVTILDEAIGLGVLLSFLNMGWVPPSPNIPFTVENVLAELRIIPEFHQAIRRFFEILSEDGYLVQDIVNRDTFEVVAEIPSKTWIFVRINSLRSGNDELKSQITKMGWSIFSTYCDQLSAFLRGDELPVGWLFPENKAKRQEKYPSAENIYSVTNAHNILETIFEKVITKRLEEGTNNNRVFQILEIGVATDSSKCLLPLLSSLGVKFHYTITNIFSDVFVKSKENFSQYLDSMSFKVLNIEEDPKAQGFSPEQFDFVIFSNVLHATQDLIKISRNIRHLLKPFGMIFICETLKPLRMFDLTLNLLPGYRNQKDFKLSIDEPFWSNVLIQSGFSSEGILTVPYYQGHFGLILAEATGECETYKNPSESSKKSQNIWLIFGNSEKLCSSLSERISSYGKQVFSVQSNVNEKSLEEICPSKNIFKIRGQSKEDWDNLFNYFKFNSIIDSIEGIIFDCTSPQDLNKPSEEGNSEENYLFNINSFFHLIQTMLNIWPSKLPKLMVISSGTISISDNDLITSPFGSGVFGMFRTYMSENVGASAKYIDILQSNKYDENNNETEVAQIIFELWSEDDEHLIAYRSGVRYKARFVLAQKSLLPYPSLPLKLNGRKGQVQRFQLEVPSTKSISDLKFVNAKDNPISVSNTQVEIEVKAAALNFRDIFAVLKPNKEFESCNQIGLDFCGVLTNVGKDVKNWKIGDHVLGSHRENVGLPSHIILDPRSLAPLPKGMSFAEGSTLPTVFLTAYHCLVTVGNLKRGQTALIHTASGGVGLCALQVAKGIGAKVIATAGSNRKRTYLRRVWGLEIIFNSRDLSFGEGVKGVTGGCGVDLVLNSLTGPGFKEMSLSCCAQNAFFVEMSKLNIWEAFDPCLKERPDVQYSVEDLATVKLPTIYFLYEMLKKHLTNKENPLKPIPYTRFDALDIRSALHYLEKTKQIGKVVCIFPSISKQNGETVTKTLLFSPTPTYLVTGGCGGVGFEVAKWMTTKGIGGARNIVIMGRRAPSEENIKDIQHINKNGGNIQIFQGDVGCLSTCRKLLAWIKESMPNAPLRGIMHCAGVLSDATLPNQTMGHYETTFHPKVRGCFNLHEVIMENDIYLEHFVMFSSVAALIGSPGQGNHVSANAILDSFANYRRSQGLTATSINWGQWGQVGIAAGKYIRLSTPMTTQECLNALELSLRCNVNQFAPVDFEYKIWQEMFPWQKKWSEALLTDKNNVKENNKEVKAQVTSESDQFWSEIKLADREEKQFEVLTSHVNRILKKLLGIQENVGLNQNFQDLGLDSLMTIQLKNKFQHLFGSTPVITTADLADCNTLSLTVKKLKSLIYKDSKTNKELALNARNQLIYDDSKLWNTIDITNSLPPSPIGSVGRVLFTGATGSLGPYVLRTLTQYPQIQKIYVLIRPLKSSTPKTRLFDKLASLQLLKSTELSKIEIIEGDVTQDRFGMEEGLYNKLGVETEAIIHCAVHSNHVEMYGKGASSKVGLKAVNVDGTQRVLQFASMSRVKHVYNASTLMNVWKTKEQFLDMEGLNSSFPDPHEYDEGPNFGYGISKHIADCLIGQAVKRGVPCKVFRFPKIVGESATGLQTTELDHFFIKYSHFLRTGLMPDVKLFLQLVPVDACADITLKLFFMPEVPSQLFNMFNPHFQWQTDLAQLTPEYGPLLRLADQVSRVVKQLEKGKIEGNEEIYISKFFELLKTNAIQDAGIDVDPIIQILNKDPKSMRKAVLENTGIIFKNLEVRQFLKDNYSYEMKVVPYSEFVSTLVNERKTSKSRSKSKLQIWLDFYTKEDAFYKLWDDIMKDSKIGRSYFGKNTKGFLSNSCAHIEQYLPNYKRLVPDGVAALKMDLDYSLENGVGNI